MITSFRYFIVYRKVARDLLKVIDNQQTVQLAPEHSITQPILLMRRKSPNMVYILQHHHAHIRVLVLSEFDNPFSSLDYIHPIAEINFGCYRQLQSYTARQHARHDHEKS